MLYQSWTIRNRKRKHEDKTEKIVSTLVGKILDAQIKTDRNLIELEEKRMKFEQRQEEREFQLRLFAMMSHGGGSFTHHSNYSPNMSPMYQSSSNSTHLPYMHFRGAINEDIND